MDQFTNTNPSPILSIIIPVYNVADYIGDCLTSCQDQDLDCGQYEIICVNDGSTDNSLDVLKTFAEKHDNIKIISKENGGVSSARNAGIEAAAGKYIWFIDSDDFIKKNCLKPLLQALEDHAAGQCVFNFEETKSGYATAQTLTAFDSQLSTQRFKTTAIWRCIMSRDTIITGNIRFNTDMTYAEGMFFIYEYSLYALESKTLNIDAAPYYYRYREGSAVHRRDYIGYTHSLVTMAKAYRRMRQREDLTDALKAEIEKKQRIATAGALFSAAKCKINHGEFLKELKTAGLYPYKLLWFSLKPNRGLVNMMVTYMEFLFPFAWYYRLFAFIFSRIYNRKK